MLSGLSVYYSRQRRNTLQQTTVRHPSKGQFVINGRSRGQFCAKAPPLNAVLLQYSPPDVVRRTAHILAGWSGDLLIAGDFNFPLDDLNYTHAKRFADILDGFGLQQHVKGPTHKKGHTLDLIITRFVVGPDVALVRSLKVRDPCIADHFAVHCELHLQKPRFGKKVVKFRKLRSIDIDSFCEDLRDSDLPLKSYSHLVNFQL